MIPRTADAAPLGILLAALFILGRIVAAARGASRPTGDARQAPPRPVARKPQTMGDLLAEMRAEIERARQAQDAPRTTFPKALAPRMPTPKPAKRAMAAPSTAAAAIESIRPAPEVIDYDTEAAAVVAERLKVAEAFTEGRGESDHAQFDQEIRKPPRKTPAPAGSGHRLREAVIWNEILSPPVSLRPPTD